MNTFIIIDDEPLAHEVIEEYCSMLPHLKLVKSCYSAMEAIEFLNENTADFMFLDINMPRLKGLDFLRTLTNPPKVIITTAYKEFAIEGFELNVIDYLLKPFSFDRLVKAVNKAVKNEVSLVSKNVITSKMESFNFFVKGNKKQHHINTGNILYLEAYGNYTKLYLENEMIISREKISYYEKFLENEGFLRVHKSFIIAIDKIKVIERNKILIDNHTVPIGLTYKSNTL
ncbi:LytR/AlgR family response regulator transcription factor [Aquimarina macrocephali]|uniref:LytR/AlgR family response regulator transcription factor n=1 Tax=Aquimarina macrocephali TaxID=666563 RepID=UPI0004B609B3|nr:LytTR family DNA-binding domain-containing protein [Aquimarina macrocephali]